MSVTLKQIAAELNVSQPLVTYALNGKPGVSPQMRQAIIETAERLGYNKYSNREARMMAARRHGRTAATGMIALIFPRFDATPWTAVPYFRAMVDGVEFEAGSRGLDLIIAPYRQIDSLPRIVLERGVDGVIFLSPPTHSEELRALELPAVSLGTPGELVHSFVPDDREGIRMAVEHLLDLGHRRIAYLGSTPATGSSVLRVNAYRDTLTKYGVAVDERLIGIAGSGRRDEGRSALASLMANAPDFTALICHNDLIAMGAVEHAQSIGMQVPDDLSVVGFDDVSADYNFQPALTSIAFGRYAMGRSAVELICSEVEARTNEVRTNGGTNTNGSAAKASEGNEAVRPSGETNGGTGDESMNTAAGAARGASNLQNRVFPVELMVRQSTARPK